MALAVMLSGTLRGQSTRIAPRTVVLLVSLFAWLCLLPSALGFVGLLLAVAAIVARRWRSLSPAQRPTLST